MEQLQIIDLLKALQKLDKRVGIALMYAGLRPPQFRLLDLLDGMGQATVSELSSALGVTRASASVLVNELIKSHCLAVIENPSDRRSFHVRMTELGRDKLAVGRSDLSVLQGRITHDLDAETIRQLNLITRRLLAPLRDESSEGL